MLSHRVAAPALRFKPRLAGSALALTALALVALALTGTARAADPPWQHDLAAWRADRATSLRAPEGWLSLVGLEWLAPGTNTIGSAPGNRVRLAGSPTHVAVLTLERDVVTLAPPAEGFPSGLTVAEKPPQPGPLSEDSALRIGTYTLLVLHRGDRYGLRIKDAHAPSRLHFTGLRWYAPGAAYRIHARWIPYTPPHDITIPTVIGTTLQEKVPGAAEFTLSGKTLRLEPIVEDGKLFFILRDLTSHTTTYGASRFLYTDMPSHGLNQPGDLLLDFNRLINPPCAYTPYATCPLPPKQNILPVALPAGEKRYHEE